MAEYDDIQAINNSSLSWFEVSPKYYDNMRQGLLKRKDEDYFDFGQAFHCAVLQPAVFNDRYVILDGVTPSHAYHVRFCEIMSSSDDSVAAYKSIYATKGKSEKDITKEAESLYDKYKKYIDILKSLGNRVLIQKEDAMRLEMMKNSLVHHKKSNELLFSDFELKDRNPNIKIEVEFTIEFFWPKLNTKCKCRLDKAIIDYDNKKIILIDLKGTSKPIKQFKYAFRKYKYARQLGFYTVGLSEYLTLSGVDLSDGWIIEWVIVAIETCGSYETKSYLVSELDVESGILEAYKLLCQIKEHEERDLWDYSIEYYDSSGYEHLILNENDNGSNEI